MVSWIWDSKFGVFIDCIDNIPGTIHHVRVSNTIRSHYVIGGTPCKIAKCTSKANRWSNWAIGNISIVLFVHDITTRMDHSLLDERKFNDAILKLLCKPFEGMILHAVCFPEVGWSKLSIDIFHLVSGVSVCTNPLNSTIATRRSWRHWTTFAAAKAAAWTAILLVEEYMTILTTASLEPPPLPETVLSFCLLTAAEPDGSTTSNAQSPSAMWQRSDHAADCLLELLPLPETAAPSFPFVRWQRRNQTEAQLATHNHPQLYDREVITLLITCWNCRRCQKPLHGPFLLFVDSVVDCGGTRRKHN